MTTPTREEGKAGQGECWIPGVPEKSRAEEWFIAKMKSGDRVVLSALPEEYAFQFTTADGTYYKTGGIVAWMPFPDSIYKSPAESALLSEVASLREELERVKEHSRRILGEMRRYKAALGKIAAYGEREPLDMEHLEPWQILTLNPQLTVEIAREALNNSDSKDGI